MKINETDPSFQAIIGRIAAVAGQTTDYVYSLWQEYERECTAADQSAVLPEFIQWYKTPLGGNKEQLEAAIQDHMAADEPQANQAAAQAEAPEELPLEPLQKWQADSTNPPGPIQRKRFEDAWNSYRSEHNTHRELWGVIGGEEHDSCMMSVFGVNVRPDVHAAQLKIGKQFNWLVSKANATAIVEAIAATFPELKKNRPVTDKRITAEQAAADRAEASEREAKRRAEEDAKRQQTGSEAARLRAENSWVTGSDLREGPRASANCKLELSRTWPHAGWSVRSDHNSLRIEWTNGPTVKQVEEITAKYKSEYGSAAAQVFGRVSYLSFRREYGSGQYQTMIEQNKVCAAILALEGIEQAGREYYTINLERFASRTDVACAARQVMEATEIPVGAEIEGVDWNKTEGGAAIPPNIYQLTLKVASVATSTTPAGGALGTVRRNTEHNGVEISFFEKPSDALRSQLQRAGFRITRRPPWKWYQKWSEAGYKRACELAGVKSEEVASTGSRVEATDGAGAYVAAQEEAYFDRQAEMIGA